VRKERYKGGTVGAGRVCQQRNHAFLFQVLLNPTLTHGRAEPGDSHPIMKEWGGDMGGSQPDEGGLGHPQAAYRSPQFFPFLVCLIARGKKRPKSFTDEYFSSLIQSVPFSI
jgi:hypothetical protein